KIMDLAAKHGRKLAPHFAMEVHLHLSAAYPLEPWLEHFEWLNEIAGIAQNQLLVFPETGQHFPGGDRRIQRGSKLGMAFDV
ncbi:hypothetical protein MJI69_32185, partial [Salmonella enterica subsp. enterica serovar Anatum]|nr:hypothetical protein [Salmonella enterica subsp. enterica serovar Anatum]